MSTVTLLLIALVVLLLAGLPLYPYSRGFGWGPSTTIGAAIVVIIILLLAGYA